MLIIAELFIISALLAGCAISPSLNILGAFFPDWLFCMAGGLGVVILTHSILLKKGLVDKIGPPFVVYPALVIIFSLAAWIIFFD